MELATILGGIILLLFAIVIAKLRNKDTHANAISILLTGYLLIVGTML